MTFTPHLYLCPDTLSLVRRCVANRSEFVELLLCLLDLLCQGTLFAELLLCLLDRFLSGQPFLLPVYFPSPSASSVKLLRARHMLHLTRPMRPCGRAAATSGLERLVWCLFGARLHNRQPWYRATAHDARPLLPLSSKARSAFAWWHLLERRPLHGRWGPSLALRTRMEPSLRRRGFEQW